MTIINPPYEVLKQFPQKLFINGEWLEALDGKTFKVYNPANGDVIAEVPLGGTKETEVAIEAAEQAFPSWSSLSGRQRAYYLEQVFQTIRNYRKELAMILTLEQGKPFFSAEAEVKVASSVLQWYLEEAKRVGGEIVTTHDLKKRVSVIRQPVGIVAAITPWNFPVDLTIRKIAPALAAGCTVVLKPSNKTPLSAMALISLFEQVGLPKGIVNLVVGRTQEISEGILSNPKVRKITLTGSTEVGKTVMEKAARQLKRVSLELGGKAPYIVCQDADVEKAVEGIINSKFQNSGQVCVGPNSLYVHRSIAEEFSKKLSQESIKIKVGPGWYPDVKMGPLINESSLCKVDQYVQDAQKKGAIVLNGGQRLISGELGKGAFYSPTVIYQANEEMFLAQEEIFGPVVPIFIYDDEDEVLFRANNTLYGLAGYIYTNDINRAVYLSEGLECGVVGVNDPFPVTTEAPFGGIKESGIGREGGRWGLEEFTELKTISYYLK